MNMRLKTPRNLSWSRRRLLSITVFPDDPGPTASALMGTRGMMAVGDCLMWYSGKPFWGLITGICLYSFGAESLSLIHI